MIDVHLWDLHFKVVGQQLDGLAHGAHAWPAGGMEHLLQGRGEGPQGHWTDRLQEGIHEDRKGRGRGLNTNRDRMKKVSSQRILKLVK